MPAGQESDRPKKLKKVEKAVKTRKIKDALKDVKNYLAALRENKG